MPNFGDIPADQHFGYETKFFHHSPGDTTITAGTYLDVAPSLDYPMPAIARADLAIIMSAQVYLYIDGTGYQYVWADPDLSVVTVQGQSITPPLQSSTPRTSWNYASATNSWPIQTMTLFGWWRSFDNNNWYPAVRITAGGGTPNVIFRTFSGYCRYVRV